MDNQIIVNISKFNNSFNNILLDTNNYIKQKMCIYPNYATIFFTNLIILIIVYYGFNEKIKENLYTDSENFNKVLDRILSNEFLIYILIIINLFSFIWNIFVSANFI